MQVKNVRKSKEKGCEPTEEAANIYRNLLIKLQAEKKARRLGGEEREPDDRTR